MSSNRASTAGALQVTRGNGIHIWDSVIFNNSVSMQGSAIYLQSSNSVFLRRNFIISNQCIYLTCRPLYEQKWSQAVTLANIIGYEFFAGIFASIDLALFIVLILSSLPMFFCICIRRRKITVEYAKKGDLLSVFFDWWLSSVGVGFPNEIPALWAILHRIWCLLLIVITIFRICSYFSWVPLFAYDSFEQFTVAMSV